MKKTIKLVVGGLLLALAGSSYAIDGRINFTGAIIKTACVINNGSDVDVQLGTYSAAQFQQIGDTSPEIPFTLPLTNCPVAQKDTDPVPHFVIWMEADAVDATHPNLVKLANSFGDPMADGVGIQIMDAATKQVMLLNTLPTLSYDIKTATMNINLLANYQSFKNPTDITAGPADASVNVTLDYR
ncbi:fimbrial protein [Rahnella woolbedingensis]|uniref:Type 1 fimbrial protein n=1 Tax=Rahnella woolbedingensis TaxID=1510574 RepID=A0A419N5R5_9GAMM|nr:fimbrial protein [Rahnella woolbedingensis]RJT42136.1 type 1 fimbrial protein [Rahnella woolbedingensis]